jgi:hypothetical protein
MLRFHDSRHISSKIWLPAGPRALQRVPRPPADLLVGNASRRTAPSRKKFNAIKKISYFVIYLATLFAPLKNKKYLMPPIGRKVTPFVCDSSYVPGLY